MKTSCKGKRIFVAGLGSIGKRHLAVLHQIGVRCILAYDTEPSVMQSVAAQNPWLKLVDSFEEGLEKADAIFILTPPASHIPLAVQAMEKGLDVFCEKPISDNDELLDQLRETIRRTQRKFMVGLCFRFHEGVVRLKTILQSGELGRVVSIRSMMGEYFPDVRPDYKRLFSSKYLGALDLMHDIDLAIWFAGQNVRDVVSVAGSFSDIGIEAPDLVELLLEFPDRCVASVHLDYFQRPRRRELELLCTGGTAKLEFGSWDEYTLPVFSAREGIWKTVRGQTARNDMFVEEDMHFLDAISGQSPILCPLEEGEKSLRVITSVLRSGKSTKEQ